MRYETKQSQIIDDWKALFRLVSVMSLAAFHVKSLLRLIKTIHRLASVGKYDVDLHLGLNFTNFLMHKSGTRHTLKMFVNSTTTTKKIKQIK